MMGGFILSEDGTPMHASLGNVIDPIEVINKYGSDAFRCYAASCSLGEDNPFRTKDVIRGVKLLRKIWNVQQFISRILKNEKPEKPELIDVDKWILTKYSRLVKKCTKQMDEFDYSQTLKDVEFFLWHELADHYIEMIKGSIYDNKNVESIRYALYTVVLGTLKMLAPFFPHITEEIYNDFYKQIEGERSIHLSDWPNPVLIDNEKEKSGETVKNYIQKIRSYKSENGIPLNAPINSTATYASKETIANLENSREIILTTLKYPNSHKIIAGKPDIEEEITMIKPVYSNLGPVFRKEGKKIADWINNNQEDIKKMIEKKGDITVSDIPFLNSREKKGLLRERFIQLEKKVKIKGKKDSIIILFDNFYLELKEEKNEKN
jgi:valyl-tRNA synthetase